MITNNRNNSASLNLVSDTGIIGSGSNIRGWSISKVGTSADLAFTYTNNQYFRATCSWRQYCYAA